MVEGREREGIEGEGRSTLCREHACTEKIGNVNPFSNPIE
jgi:hypothetical protein